MTKRLIALDYGEKRIGIAITDPLRMFAYPLKTIKNDNTLWEELKSLLEEYDVEKAILGYPLKESGEKTHSTEAVEKFKNRLEGRYGLLVEYVDERYTSSIAKDKILESVPGKKKRRDKSLVDKTAAYVMLQEYLETSG